MKMLEGMILLDENENEQLYKLQNDLFNTVILICNEQEFCLGDWQSNDQPSTLEEAAEYDWLPLSEVLEWHD